MYAHIILQLSSLQSSIDPPRHVLSYQGVFYSDDTLSSLIKRLRYAHMLDAGQRDLWISLNF